MAKRIPKSKPLTPDAKWATRTQVRARYGSRSDMWITRKLRDDPKFPRPVRFGERLKLFSVEALDEYDRQIVLAATE